jgi:hypothetical protein
VAVVAKFATTEFANNSSSSKIFLMCLEITDLSLWKRVVIWFNDSHTDSFSISTSKDMALSG